jgi:hypothetical protein
VNGNPLGTAMSTRRVAMIAAISALAGLVVGAVSASWYWFDSNGQFMTSNLVLGTQADILAKVSVLEHMRAGRFEHATKLLETLLDGDLIGAGALARQGRVIERGGCTVRARRHKVID